MISFGYIGFVRFPQRFVIEEVLRRNAQRTFHDTHEWVMFLEHLLGKLETETSRT